MQARGIEKLVALVGLVVLLSARTAAGDGTSYDGHQLLRAQLESADDVAVVQDIGAMVLGDGIGVGSVDIIVPPGATVELDSAGISYDVLWENVYFEARYSEEPVQAGVFVQDLDELPDALPDGGK